MIITTSPLPSEALIERAKLLAEKHGGTYISRKRLSVEQLKQRSKTGIVFILTEKEMRLYQAQAGAMQPFIYHPSMAYVKLKGMLNGNVEPLIAFSECERGDKVLDCTAGLASDALLFSLQVGKEGKVTALESQLPLYMLVSEGLKHYQSSIEEIEQAMRRIELIHQAHDSYLKALPDNSYDIVYFDPMFREPLHDSEAIKPLRLVANHNPLTKASIEEAKRIARKCIIMKEHASSDEFSRLGFTPVGKHQGKKPAYGIIWCKEV